MANAIHGHRGTATLHCIHMGRAGACAHGEVNGMSNALFLIYLNSVLNKNSLF